MTTEGGFYPRPTRGRSRADDVDAKSTAERALTRRGLSPVNKIESKHQSDQLPIDSTDARARRAWTR
jgi:hypothetical protein